MALSKLGKGITSITGKLGGDVYKRDSSGQHIISKPRTLHKLSSPDQHKQRAWYSGHKKHEHLDPGPRIPDDPPKDPFTARVYSIHNITTFRDPSVFDPTPVVPPDDPVLKASLLDQFMPYWNPEWTKYGIDLPLISELLFHYYWIAKFTWGVIHEHACLFAIEQTLIWCQRAITIGKIIAKSAWVACVVSAFIYQVWHFFEGHWGQINFGHWDMILRTSNKLYWAGLQSRPGKKMYEVCQGPELLLPIYQSWYEPDQDYGRAVVFEPGCLFQILSHAIVLYYTWTFRDTHLVIIEDAHPVGPNDYRFKGDEFSEWYLNVPIGWSRTPDECLDYLNYLDQMFVPNP